MGNATGREGDPTEEEDYAAESDDPSRRATPSLPPQPPRPAPVAAVAAAAGSQPDSPGRSLSPRMFVPQTPVPPLERGADALPVFNQILMNDHQDNIDAASEKKIPVLLVWTLGGNDVSIEGSWDNYTTRRNMQQTGKDHSILLSLPSGLFRYRFVVDGENRCLLDLPRETDENGNWVNLLDVHEYVPENLDGVSEFELPPSPDSSYSFRALDDKEFAKEPPALPPQLNHGILNMQGNDDTGLKPQHVVLNHLFIGKGWGAHPLVALSLTHRFQSKYVTVVLYKPVER